MGVDWSELPQEILELISKRLTIYIDYFRFRCVCRSWNSSVPKIPLHLPPQLPWLMLSHNSFFDLSTNKIHRLNLPMPSVPIRICGSSHGWLIILEETTDLTLLNPITGSTVSLPSLQTFPDLVTDLFKHNCLYLIKVVLSSSPTISDDFTAFAILNRKDFAFCRKGYDSWVVVNVIDSDNDTWIDAVYNNGLFYVTSMSGTIAICDVEGPQPQVSFVKENDPKYDYHDMFYAVFAGEDILLMQRYTTYEMPHSEDEIATESFCIYKMNLNVLKWEELQTLGQHSVFIGKMYSLYLSAPDFPGCRPNCIYFSNFTDDVGGKHDLGMYSLSDKRIYSLPCYPNKSNCSLGCPVWVTPNP